MKKLQCTSCLQVFWKDLDIDESQVGMNEWVQISCPRCETEWAIVEPAAGAPARRGRKAKAAVKPKGRPRKAGARAEAKTDGFSRGAIKKLRKRLGVSQKKLASLVGVSTGTVVGWESGKFKPRQNKVSELTDLEKWEKEDVRNVLSEKEAKPAEAKAQGNPAEKTPAKGKGKRRGRARGKKK